MLNIHELERRWLKYKIKSYLPHLISFVTVMCTIIALLIFLPTLKESDTDPKVISAKTTLVEKNNTSVKTVQTISESTYVAPQVPLSVSENTGDDSFLDKADLVLKPSLHFMDNIEDSLNPYMDEEIIHEEPSVTEYTDKRTRNVTEESTSIPVVEASSSQEKKKMLTITKNKDETDIKDVIRRFKKNKNPALSLFIAKRYYELEQYQNSYNYALITNEIDKGIEESWIIFSKSLVKLGQHELAVLTLKSYLKTTKSSQAEALLRKIASGDFR